MSTLFHLHFARRQKMIDERKTKVLLGIYKHLGPNSNVMNFFFHTFSLWIPLIHECIGHWSNVLLRAGQTFTMGWIYFWRSSILVFPPVYLYLISGKSSWKNQVWRTGFLACKNQFQNWNWFLQATQAVKIKFEID